MSSNTADTAGVVAHPQPGTFIPQTQSDEHPSYLNSADPSFGNKIDLLEHEQSTEQTSTIITPNFKKWMEIIINTFSKKMFFLLQFIVSVTSLGIIHIYDASLTGQINSEETLSIGQQADIEASSMMPLEGSRMDALRDQWKLFLGISAGFV
ncbi:hypothetical protein BDQ17DRAFT_1544794, partial [Cyathus striatus]